MKWSISPWLCQRSLANSRCLDLEMPYALLVWIQLKWVWHWRGSTSSCRLGLKGNMLGIVFFFYWQRPYSGPIEFSWVFFLNENFQCMLCMNISKWRWVTSCWFSKQSNHQPKELGNNPESNRAQANHYLFEAKCDMQNLSRWRMTRTGHSTYKDSHLRARPKPWDILRAADKICCPNILQQFGRKRQSSRGKA